MLVGVVAVGVALIVAFDRAETPEVPLDAGVVLTPTLPDEPAPRRRDAGRSRRAPEAGVRDAASPRPVIEDAGAPSPPEAAAAAPEPETPPPTPEPSPATP